MPRDRVYQVRAIWLAAKGDLMNKRQKAEYEAFVEASCGSLFRSAYLLTGDYHEAEDLLQAALPKAHVSWGKVRGADHPNAYVRKIV